MGSPQRRLFCPPLALSPLVLLAACGVVTADDGGLFEAGGAAAVAGGAGGAGGAAAPGGAGGAGPPPPSAQTISGADSCANAFPIALGYGAGKNTFRGTGDTKGDGEAVDAEPACDLLDGASVGGPDRVHAVTVDAPDGGYLTARLLRGEGKTEFDSVLYLRTTCDGSAGALCADASDRDVAGARVSAKGGELLSVPVLPGGPPLTFFLFVDGLDAAAAGRYELEVSLHQGDCDDPVPIFVEPGSPVRAKLSTKVARNVMAHSCGISGTADVIYSVTRAVPGPLAVALNTVDNDFALTLMDQTCSEKSAGQQERLGKCGTGVLPQIADAWPDAQRSIFLAVEAGNAPGLDERVIDVVFDPSNAQSDLLPRYLHPTGTSVPRAFGTSTPRRPGAGGPAPSRPRPGGPLRPRSLGVPPSPDIDDKAPAPAAARAGGWARASTRALHFLSGRTRAYRSTTIMRRSTPGARRHVALLTFLSFAAFAYACGDDPAEEGGETGGSDAGPDNVMAASGTAGFFGFAGNAGRAGRGGMGAPGEAGRGGAGSGPGGAAGSGGENGTGGNGGGQGEGGGGEGGAGGAGGAGGEGT